MEKATFAAGCFWGVEARLREIPGVIDAVVGYTGGRLAEPAYRDVCSGATGHAEAVEVAFDAARVSFAELLDAFWTLHDPTTPNRQGPDAGTQYRSAIFCHGAEQERIARGSKARLEASGRFARPVVTEIVPAGRFWRAEEYHQRYLEKRGAAACGISH
jgi:peptide-methionine (S)-S-oxide reductase